MGSTFAGTRLWRNLLIAGGVALALLQVFRAFHGKQTAWITNDGDWYYAYCASLYFDHDLDLSNQMNTWAAQTYTEAPKLVPGRPTPTAFTIGPALLWIPAFAAADLVTWARGGERDGYGTVYQLAVALATLLYGLAGVCLALKTASAWPGQNQGDWGHAAGAASIAALCASPALYYLFFEPTMAHGLSLFAASLLVWLWLGAATSARWGRWAGMGLAAGLCGMIRPQDGLLLALPLSTAFGAGWRQAVGKALTLVLAAGLGFAPQMVVWTMTFGQPLVTPQGPEFMEWLHPHLAQVWFSPHHGLFTWTPIWLLALLALASARGERRRSATAMLAVFLLVSYVNSCARDWWGGDAFGARRFLGLFPILLLGLTLALSRRPRWAITVAGVAILANLALMGLYVTGRLVHG